MKGLGFTIGYVLSAIIIQLLCGNFPVLFMSFPVNICVALLWMALTWYGYKEAQNNKLIQMISSLECSIVSISLFIAAMLIVGLFPQNSDILIDGSLLSALGVYDFTGSWIFIAILFLLMTNLGFITIKGIFHKKKNRYRFLLNHIGLWLALFAGFLGSSDAQTLRVPAYKGTSVRESYDINGKMHTLPYEITFNSLKVDYYENGAPKHFAADIVVGDENALVEVNAPFKYNITDDVYLISYDPSAGSDSQYCVLQVVSHPWKYVMLTGIAMMLMGALLLFINGSKKQGKNR